MPMYPYANVRQLEDKGTFAYTDAGGEQTIFEQTSVLRRTIKSVSLDLVNITKDGTIKVYSKIDGTNYRECESYIFNVATASDGVTIKLNMGVTDAFKVTYTESSDEGASRNIPYVCVYEVGER